MNTAIALAMVVGTLSFQESPRTKITIEDSDGKVISHTEFLSTVTYKEAIARLKGFAVFAYAIPDKPIAGRGWPIKIKGQLNGQVNVRLVLLATEKPVLQLKRADWEKLPAWILVQGKELTATLETNRLAWREELEYGGEKISFRTYQGR